jgi:deoxyribonuclease-4
MFFISGYDKENFQIMSKNLYLTNQHPESDKILSIQMTIIHKKNLNPAGFRIGVHTSIAGGISRSVERAVKLGCNTMQIFSHSPRQWHKTWIPEHEVERFKYLRKKYSIHPVFIHASYLINLTSYSREIAKKSAELLSYELMLADRLEIEYVVLHTGTTYMNNKKTVERKTAHAIKKVMGKNRYRVRILLENTAGRYNGMTSSIRFIGDIIDMCPSETIGGICIDTCHAFSSGYDFSSLESIKSIFNEIDKYIGINNLKLIHLNDSKKPLASGIDRHEHIGKGYIGINGFRNLFSHKKIKKIPMILETPKDREDDDIRNLKKVFNLLLPRKTY